MIQIMRRRWEFDYKKKPLVGIFNFSDSRDLCCSGEGAAGAAAGAAERAGVQQDRAGLSEDHRGLVTTGRFPLTKCRSNLLAVSAKSM